MQLLCTLAGRLALLGCIQQAQACKPHTTGSMMPQSAAAQHLACEASATACAVARHCELLLSPPPTQHLQLLCPCCKALLKGRHTRLSPRQLAPQLLQPCSPGPARCLRRLPDLPQPLLQAARLRCDCNQLALRALLLLLLLPLPCIPLLLLLHGGGGADSKSASARSSRSTWMSLVQASPASDSCCKVRCEASCGSMVHHTATTVVHPRATLAACCCTCAARNPLAAATASAAAVPR